VNLWQQFDPAGGPGTEDLRLPPWEERHRYGLFNALFLTVREVLLAPGRFFHRMPSRLGLVQPVLFAVIVGVIAALFDWIWSLSGSSLQMLVDSDLNALQAPVFTLVMFILSPLVVVVQVLLRAAIFHLCLVIVGGNRLGFEATGRVVAYAHAATLLSVLPLCGAVVGAVWEIVATVVGLARIHDVEEWRPLVAVLLPLVLLMVFCGGLLAALAGFGLLNH